jgi:hypothetical protein
MSEHSDNQAIANREQIDKWWTEFLESPYFAELSDQGRADGHFIVSVFGDLMYSHEAESPQEWSPTSLDEVCVKWAPAKITAKDECFEVMAPVLATFFRFLADNDYQPQAERLATKVAQLGPSIVENAQDPGNWGPSKACAMAAIGAGVDLHDQDEMNAFMARYNEMLTTSAQSDMRLYADTNMGYQGRTDPAWHSPTTQKSRDDAKKKRQKRKAQKQARKRNRKK